MQNFYLFTFAKLFALIAGMAVLMFFFAQTFNYWQAWVFLVIFTVASLIITIYLSIKNTNLLRSRTAIWPNPEKGVNHGVLQILSFLIYVAMLVIPAFDYRYHWSNVPIFAVIIGDIFVGFGFFVKFITLKTNTFASTAIEIAFNHKVISSGPYSLVRHPMYLGNIILFIGISLSLASWWGLLVLLVSVPVLIWRVHDEEKYLNENLPGYLQYGSAVKNRLVPFIW